MATILVVDDELQVRQTMERFLKNRGHTVVTAEEGDAGLERVRTEWPNLVFLDIDMPGKDGVTILKEIKELQPELPVVMITGIGQDDVGRKALNLGAFEYITKPVDFKYLEKILEMGLRLSP